MQRLQAFGGCFSHINTTMNDMRGIGSRTASKTDGMFCYPRLVLDFITSSLCYSLEEVKESIAELPQGLFDFVS